MAVVRSGRRLVAYLALPTLAALVAAISLLRQSDVAYLDIDAVQYLSVARNLLDGSGLSTSLVYYEEHLKLNRMPAPQTVFPPGMPLVMTGFLAIGLEPPEAAHVAGVLFFCASGLAIALLLYRFDVGPVLTGAAMLIWLVQGTAWANVLIGRTETLFTFLTFLAMMALLWGQSRLYRYLLAGSLAAAAVLVRYQGIFFVITLGAWCAWMLWRTPAQERWRFAGHAAALLSLPCITTAYLIIRNLVLIGSPGGGPVDTAYLHPAHGIGVVQSAYWALIPALGLSLDGLLEWRWRELAVLAGMVMLAVWVAGHLRVRRAADARTGDVRGRGPMGRLVVVYVVVTLVSLGFLATRSTGYMEGRFFVPLVPLVVVAWIVVVHDWLVDPRIRRKAMLVAALCVLQAGLLAGQVQVIRERLADMHQDQRMAALRAALSEDYDGIRLEQFLRQHVTIQSPLLATGGQQLWLLLQLPIVETTPAGFTQRVFDEREMNRLSRCYGIRYLMYVPGWFRAGRLENRNQPLLEAIAGGEDPQSMIRRLRTRNVAFYEFKPLAGADDSNTQEIADYDCR